MASRTGNGPQEVPVSTSRDPRVPLRRVKFVGLVPVEGASHMVTELEAGVRRIVDGKDWLPPAMWLDRDLRVVKVGAWSYPLERVLAYEQATAAITKPPPPLDLSKFTIRKGP